jgi:Rrf2 family protein
MKLSAQEEYGLRCLLQLARRAPGTSLTIPEISQSEGISTHNVAKLLRILRQEGFVESARGQHGGYTLSRPAKQIRVSDVLNALGGRLYDPDFCDHFAGSEDNCAHSFAACSVRALWGRIQQAVDQALGQITLRDLLSHSHYKFHESPKTGDPFLQISSSE